MKRYLNGDATALSQAQGQYLDATQFPKTYADMLNFVNEQERAFMALPADVREKFGNSFTEYLAASGEPDFLERLGFKKEPAAEPTPAIPEVKEVTKE